MKIIIAVDKLSGVTHAGDWPSIRDATEPKARPMQTPAIISKPIPGILMEI